MAQTFAMRGNKSEVYHGAHSRTPLEIRGSFSMSGPQPVGDDGGVPTAVAEIFRAMPHCQTISLGNEKGGVVYSRLASDPSKGTV